MSFPREIMSGYLDRSGAASFLGIDQFSRRLLVALVAVEAVLVAMHFVCLQLGPPLDRLRLWFDLDWEATIPAWFSSSQLLVTALILWLLAGLRRHKDRSSSFFFVFFGFLFLCLSIDEATRVHEQITSVLHDEAWAPAFRGTRGVWVFVYGAIGVAVLALFYPEMQAFRERYRAESRGILAGIALLLAGAVGVEVTGYYLDDRIPDMAMQILIALEEFLEMAGGSLVLCSVLTVALRRLRVEALA